MLVTTTLFLCPTAWQVFAITGIVIHSYHRQSYHLPSLDRIRIILQHWSATSPAFNIIFRQHFNLSSRYNGSSGCVPVSASVSALFRLSALLSVFVIYSIWSLYVPHYGVWLYNHVLPKIGAKLELESRLCVRVSSFFLLYLRCRAVLLLLKDILWWLRISISSHHIWLWVSLIHPWSIQRRNKSYNILLTLQWAFSPFHLFTFSPLLRLSLLASRTSTPLFTLPPNKA